MTNDIFHSANILTVIVADKSNQRTNHLLHLVRKDIRLEREDIEMN